MRLEPPADIEEGGLWFPWVCPDCHVCYWYHPNEHWDPALSDMKNCCKRAIFPSRRRPIEEFYTALIRQEREALLK